MIDIIKNITVLYVEDEKDCRESVSSIFNNIFKKVFIASDGEEALEHYKNNKNEIDIIISDINMPKVNGIELLKEIRKEDEDLAFIITSAYTDSKYLLQSIELNVTAYILKPLDIKILMQKISYICKEKDNTKRLLQKDDEIQLYLEAINKVAIVSKTDLKGNITYVNDIFCEVAKYKREELIGKNHNIVRHPDISKQVFKDLWENISNGKKWNGKIKNKAKDGSDYYVNATIFPFYSNNSKVITGYIGIRFLITDDEKIKREFKKKVLVNISETKQKEHKLVSNNSELEEQIKSLTSLNTEKENSIIDLNKHIIRIQDFINDLEQKNLSKDRQLTHYELQMENVDKRVYDASKKKASELEKNIKLNQILKDEKEIIINDKKILENNIVTINKRNEILKDDNIKKLRRIEELEDVISHIEQKNKK